MANIANLIASLQLETVGFIRNAERAERALKQETVKIRRHMREIERSAKGVERAFGRVRAGAAGLLGALAVRQFSTFTRTALDNASALKDVADKVNLTTAQLQEMRFAAEQTGVAQNALDLGMQRFARRLADARAQGKGFAGVLNTAEIQGKTTSEALDLLADKIQQTTNSQDQLLIAFKAFDSEGAALVNTLRDGSEGLAVLREEARDAGIVISDNLIASAKVASDAIAAMESAFNTGFNIGIIRGFAGQVERSADALREARDFGVALGSGVAIAMRGVANAAKTAADNLDLIVGAIAGIAALKGTLLFLTLADALRKAALASGAAIVSFGTLQTILGANKKIVTGLAVAIVAAGAAYLGFSDRIEEFKEAVESGIADAMVSAQQALIGFADESVNATDELRRQVQQQERLNNALKISAQEHAKVQAEIERENAIYALLVRGVADVDGEYENLYKRLQELRSEFDIVSQAHTEAQEKLKQAAKESAEFIPNAFERAFDRVGNTITDAIARGEGSLLSLSSIGKAVAADLAQSFLQLAAINPLKNSLLGTTSPTLFGAAGATAAGGAGGGGGLLGGLGTSIAGSALGKSIGSLGIGAKLLGTAATDGAAATSGLIGSGGNLFGLSGLGAGAALAGAGLAAAIVLPKLFESSSVGPNAGGQLRFSGDRFVVGPTGADNGGDISGIEAALSNAAQALNALVELPDFSIAASKTFGGDRNPIAGFIDTFGSGGVRNADDLVRDVISKGVIAGLTDDETKRILGSQNVGQGIADVLSIRQGRQPFLDDLRLSLLDITNPRAAALERANSQFDALEEQAKTFNVFADAIGDIDKLRDLRIAEIIAQFGDAANDNAEALSAAAIKLKQVESQLSSAEQNLLSRQSNLQNFFAGVRSPLEGLRNSLLLGGASPLSAADRFGLAQQNFRGLAEQALTLDARAVSDLPAFAQTFIEQAGLFGASPLQSSATAEVIGVLDNVLAKVNQLQADNAQDVGDTIRVSIGQQTKVLVDELRELRSAVDSLRAQRDDLQRDAA